MLKLRPLIVVTGTAHVEGGEKSRRQSGTTTTAKKRAKARGRVTVTEDLEISPDRRRANVIAVNYSRQIKRLAVIRTDFGMLFLPEALPELQRILIELTRRAVEFNRTATTAKVANCFLWENLQGNRKAAVEGWLARGELECDKEVQGALQVLDELRAVPARAGGASSMAAEG
jgi:hypothetical protein